MAYESLSHKEKKGSTAKWFAIAIIPILGLYWLWKAAGVVSGHEKRVLKKYETLEHMDKKESTGRWFGIFLIPVILAVLAALAASSGIVAVAGLGIMAFDGIATAVALGSAAFGGGITAAVALGILAFIVGIYVLYKMAVDVSGHETWYPEKYEAVNHKEKKDSTVKWFVFAILPILNIYFLWKMGETISGHETVYK